MAVMKAIQMFVEEKCADPEVVRLFNELSDYLREGAEEEASELNVRKAMVHSTIEMLCKLYW